MYDDVNTTYIMLYIAILYHDISHNLIKYISDSMNHTIIKNIIKKYKSVHDKPVDNMLKDISKEYKDREIIQC